MVKRVRFSLATKCQIMFGVAVVLIIATALTVVWVRMQRLVEHAPRKRAQDFATAWLADQIQLGGVLMGVDASTDPLPLDRDLSLSLIEPVDYERVSEIDPFVGKAIEDFETSSNANERFVSAVDEWGNVYYRYARAIRKRDLSRLGGGIAAGFSPTLDTSGLANPLQMVLLIQLRDPQAQIEQARNRIYIFIAGTVAGLLAIAVFWFITTRIILSPVRVLRRYAQQASEGDLNIRSEISTGDEFEQLSDMFNAMLENLKQKQQELQAANKSLDLRLGELAESNVALYEANKIKGEFLANVSHELRTPLNSIVGFAEVLEESFDGQSDEQSEKRKRYSRNIISSSRRLLELINDLLDLAKIEAGRVELRVEPVSVKDLCEALVGLIRPLAQQKDIDVRIRMDPNMPIVHTDAGKLQQILFNFLSNAVKFNPMKGTVTLAASLMPASKPTEIARVRLSVSDTGPGIALEDQARIFEKFTQLDPSVTRAFGGTGLGLTISRELADMLKGTIEVDSTQGQGATFSLTVPIVLEQKKPALMDDLSEA